MTSNNEEQDKQTWESIKKYSPEFAGFIDLVKISMGEPGRLEIEMNQKTTVIRTEQDKQNYLKAVQGAVINKPLRVTTELYKKKRSVDQNALYWLWVAELSNETGYTKDEMHDILRFKCNLVKNIEIDNTEIMQLKSTTKLNVSEFIDYLVAIENFAASIDVALPKGDLWREATQ